MVAGGAWPPSSALGVGHGRQLPPLPRATTSSGNTGAAAHGQPAGGMARPTVAGQDHRAERATTSRSRRTRKTSVTVVYSSSTTFKTNPGPNGGTTSSASALKVGDFVGVQGTKNSDGTVPATAVVIGRPPRWARAAPAATGGAPRAARHRAAGAPSA